MDKIRPEFAYAVEGSILEAEYFYYDTKPGTDVRLAIICGGHEKCAPDFEIIRNSYPYFVVEYYLGGKGSILIGEKEYELKNGTFLAFPPGVAHHYKTNPEDTLEHIFLAIIGTEIKSLLAKCGLENGGTIQTENPQRALDTFMQIMETGLENTDFSQELCSNYLRVIMLELASQNIRKKMKTSKSFQTYRQCKRYIDENFSEIFAINEVAAKCGINFRYMSRLFKKHAKISPHNYVMRLKLNKAGRLLLTTELPIKTIAKAVGFEDPFHFSRNFRNHHGLSPSHYRERHLK